MFSSVTYAEIVSYSVSVVVSLISILFPFMAFVLLFDKRKAIANENQTYIKRFGTMFADFKTEGKWY